MRLKSLELNGYKTFANQTIFEFAGAVTAIVGPNGSGKSNVADGLRWVLGEQTYSLMRAKRTEDMIYAGSQHRSRSGMASVTVVLDNQDGWLPIDYSEVAIARRAYRDGMNEYLLNKQRVRLRDISELLAKCGLAERTYTIIGQGLVDAALALKAEERRRLFEEAAGIGLFRARREDALHRLDLTHRNLDRVRDILTELEPRLKSLERQAHRVKEYERVRADLRSVLREWYGYQWMQAQTELVDSQALVKQKEKVLEETRQRQIKLAEQLNTLRDRSQNIRHDLTQWHRRLAELHFQRESLSKKLAVIQERLRSSDEERMRIKNALSLIEEDIKQHKERLDTAKSELKSKEADLSECHAQVENTKADLTEREKKQTDVETEYISAQEEYASLLDRKNHLQGRLRDNQEILKRLSAELDDFDKQIENSKAHYLNIKNDYQVAEGLYQSAHSEGVRAVELWNTHLSQIDQLQSHRLRLAGDLGYQQIELDGLKSKISIFEQAERDLTGYASGARLLLEAARDHRIPGVKGSLNRLFEVPSQFETAIVSVLGEFLDAIVIDNKENLDRAVSILENETARAAIVSIDQIKSKKLQLLKSRIQQKKILLESNGVLGIASELVKVNNEFIPIIDLLLGNVLVVRDRESAIRALSEFSGCFDGLFNAGAVTLQGEFYIAHGAVLIGREAQAGILGREHIKQKLENNLKTVDRNFHELLRKVEELDSKIMEQKSVGDKLGEMLEKAETRELKTKKTFDNVEIELNQAEHQRSWLEKKRENLFADINQKRANMGSISEELQKIQGELSRLESNLNEKNERLEELTIESIKANLNHWEKRAAVAEQAFADASKRMTERKEILDKAQDEHKVLQERLQAIVETIANLEIEKEGLTIEELQINQLISQQKSLIEPAENDLHTFESELDDLQKAEGEARVSLNMAEHHNAQARISLAKCQETLVSLRRRIEDDFGLVDFEYSSEISGPKPLPLHGLVEQLPKVKVLNPGLEDNLKRQKSLLRRIGPVNPEAEAEYLEVKERHDFLTEQLTDLGEAETDIRQIIIELDKLMDSSFRDTFESVATEFRQIFIRLFGGGSARLTLTDPNDLTNSGIEIEARLPGRREQGLALLSGGERSLAAVALVFALLKVSPTPFCILDEVDAMLDESNVNRFSDLLKELSSTTQFIIITHNPNTLQVADVIYGVTMGKDSSSRVISLKMDEYEKAHIV